MSAPISAATLPRVYPAKVLRVIDADTYDVEVDLGFRMVARLPLRLAHVDAPEHNTAAGQAAIAYVKQALGDLPASVIVTTFKPVDKYGRYLAEVHVPLLGDLAALLVSLGWGVPYEGGEEGVTVTAVRPNGKPYARRAPAQAEPFTTMDESTGVVVTRTHDEAEARLVAADLLAEHDLDDMEPRLDWWRLVPFDTGTGHDQNWVTDHDRGVPVVIWYPTW